ncbi:MAG: hypothetical protein Q8Q48_02320 [Candidatus Staskawiczbacteria bacterium]|nr:hypothetical protein [Candidatus Staskawiczbacteria bacterium]
MDLYLGIILVVGFFVVTAGVDKMNKNLVELSDYLKEKFGETEEEFNNRMETELAEEQKDDNKK